MKNNCKCGKPKYRRAYKCPECWPKVSKLELEILLESRKQGKGSLRLGGK